MLIKRGQLQIRRMQMDIVSVFFKQYYGKQIKYLHDLEFQDKLIIYRIKET